MLKTITAIILCCCAITANAENNYDKTFMADIKELMYATGSDKMAMQVMNQMVESFKSSTPSVPEEFWQKFQAKSKGDDFVDLIAPVYAKHFTHDEIISLRNFYKTPLGQKVIATMPAVMQESMALGGAWGQKLGEEIIQEMAAAGYN